MNGIMRSVLASAAIIVIAALVVGCGSSGTAPAPTSAAPKPTQAASKSPDKSADTGQKPAAAAPDAAKAGDGSAQAMLEALAKLPAAERQQKLEEGAKKDGKVVAYVLGDIETWEAIKRDFQKKYPFLTMEYLRAGSEEILDRILAESRAGKLAADFVMNSKSYVLMDEGIVIPYDSPAKQAIPEKFRGKYEVQTDVNPIVIAWNTNMVSAADAPKTWEDLLDPKWKGKMAQNTSPDVMMVGLYEKLGVEKGRDYMRKLMAMDLIPSRSHTTVIEQLAAGEFPIAAEAYGYRVVQMKREKKAPVGWTLPDPMPSTVSSQMIAKTTTHPYATALFADYMMSAEAGNIYASFGRLPLQPGANLQYPDDQRPMLESKNLFSLTPEVYRKHFDTVSKDMKEIVQSILGQ